MFLFLFITLYWSTFYIRLTHTHRLLFFFKINYSINKFKPELNEIVIIKNSDSINDQFLNLNLK